MDSYMGFTFNGTTLESYKGFIKNELEELAFNMPTFSNSFVTPPYGNRPFYLGNTKEHRTFELDVVLNEVTLDEYRDFLDWLGMDKKGVLVFDYNPNYGYDVKLDSIGKANFVVVPDCSDENNPVDKYIIEVPIVFITTGDWAAKWVEEGRQVYWSNNNGGTDKLIDNEDDENFIQVDGTSITIHNHHKIPNYFILEYIGGFIITEGSNTLFWDKDMIGTKIFYSQYGIVVDSTTKTFVPVDTASIIEIPADGSRTFSFVGNVSKITPTSREII